MFRSLILALQHDHYYALSMIGLESCIEVDSVGHRCLRQKHGAAKRIERIVATMVRS